MISCEQEHLEQYLTLSTRDNGKLVHNISHIHVVGYVDVARLPKLIAD